MTTEISKTHNVVVENIAGIDCVIKTMVIQKSRDRLPAEKMIIGVLGERFFNREDSQP